MHRHSVTFDVVVAASVFFPSIQHVMARRGRT